MNHWPSKRENVVNVSAEDNWDKLSLVLKSVEKNYVDDIDYRRVMEDIIPNVMAELDPHSVYLPPQDLKEAEESLQGGFDGIGIQFNVPNDTAIVTNVIVGGPSQKAGLMTGDRIVKVDNKVVAGVKMHQDSIVATMRGKKGTRVVVYVKRSGEDGLIPFDIIRDKIPVHSVDIAYMINDTTGYLKLSRFARTSYKEYLVAMAKLSASGKMKKLIFDLRDNSGGYLDQALMLSNDFLEKDQMIVYMEGKNRPRQDMKADGSGLCKDLELAVLINETSASSSEIFAGAMQDNDRATIYGVRSFGKGLVQEPVYFSDGSGIRLTVARFYTPTGRCIQKPYSEDYEMDILKRYNSGELFSVDSIKVVDSLKYTTPKGKIVYGGGGIIPDVFVPLDTLSSSNFIVKCNRLSLQIKYANEVSDRYREQLREIKTLRQLYSFFGSVDLESGFLAYAKKAGVSPRNGEWNSTKDVIMVQVEALVGRYSAMGDDAFYPIYAKIDNVIQKALQ